MSQTSGNKVLVKTTVNLMTLSEIKSEPGLLVVDVKGEPKDLSIDPVANAEIPKGFVETFSTSVAGYATKSDHSKPNDIANVQFGIASEDLCNGNRSKLPQNHSRDPKISDPPPGDLNHGKEASDHSRNLPREEIIGNSAKQVPLDQQIVKAELIDYGFSDPESEDSPIDREDIEETSTEEEEESYEIEDWEIEDDNEPFRGFTAEDVARAVSTKAMRSPEKGLPNDNGVSKEEKSFFDGFSLGDNGNTLLAVTNNEGQDTGSIKGIDFLPRQEKLESQTFDLQGHQDTPPMKEDESAAVNMEGRLYCFCRGPESAGMIGCDFCDEWYHADCLGLTQVDVSELMGVKWCCPQCDYNRAVQVNKKRKQLEMIKSKEKLYKCPWCEGTFTALSSLRRHKRIHTNEKPFKCTICSEKFRYRRDLKKHESVHTNEMPFSCLHCDKKFPRADSLKRHSLLHAKEKPYSCAYCDKKFIQANDCKNHELIHTGEKPFQCSYCKKRFRRPDVLKTHEKIHTIEKSFKCSQCDESFRYILDLKKHEALHTSEKLFSCSQCGKTFICEGSVKRHEKTHAGVKPFSCSVCSKKFIEQSGLNRHMRIHKDEITEGQKRSKTIDKSFPCTYCEKKFSRLDILKKHERIHVS